MVVVGGLLCGKVWGRGVRGVWLHLAVVALGGDVDVAVADVDASRVRGVDAATDDADVVRAPVVRRHAGVSCAGLRDPP